MAPTLAGRWALISSVAMLLAGCSTMFFIEPAGTLATGVEFRLFDPEHRPSSRTLREFVVQVDSRDTWVTIWEIEGEQSLDRVVYEASYPDLRTIVDAKPLEAGRVYRVLAKDMTGVTAPIGYGEMHFRINADGVARKTSASSGCDPTADEDPQQAGATTCG